MGKQKSKQKINFKEKSDKFINEPSLNDKTLYHKNSFIKILLLLLCLTGFIYSQQVPDLALTPRYVYFIAITLIITIYNLSKNLSSAFVGLNKYFFISYALYVLWSILGMYSAINPMAGFWEWMRLIVNLLLVLNLIIIFISFKIEFSFLAKILSIVGIVHWAIGYLEYTGNPLPIISVTDGVASPVGLMANRNLFGSAQILLLPIAIYTCLNGNTIWKIIGFLSSVLVTHSSLISYTRMSWLAGFVSLIFFVVMCIFFLRDYRKQLFIFLTGYIFITGAMIFVLTQADETGEFGFRMKSTFGLHKIISSTDANNSAKAVSNQINALNAEQQGAVENISERFLVWKKTVQLVKDNMLFGVGKSNWPLNILKYGTANTSWDNGYFTPDRPHNVYLNILAESGIPGFLFFMAAFIIVGIIGLKQIINKNNTLQNKLAIISCLAVMLNFFADCMGSFPIERIENTLYLLIATAVILSYNYSVDNKPNYKLSIRKNYIGIAASIFLVCNLILGVKKIGIEKNIGLAKAYQDANIYDKTIEYTEAAQSTIFPLDHNYTPIENRALAMYSDNIKPTLQKSGQQAADALSKKAKKMYEIASKKHPYMVLVYNNYGTVFTNESKFDSAIKYYKKALDITPRFQAALKNLVINYSLLGKKDSVLTYYQYVKTEPRDSATLKNIARRALAEYHNAGKKDSVKLFYSKLTDLQNDTYLKTFINY